MFGHDSLPSRNYRYGAKPPSEGLEIVESQMRLAHKYRNRLVELELTRRAEVDSLTQSVAPRLADLKQLIAKLETEIKAERDAIKAVNAKQRKRVKNDIAAASIKAKKQTLSQLRAERKALRTTVFESQEWKHHQETISTQHKEALHHARKASGLFWGTYLIVEQAMSGACKGAPPRFQRWNGDGRIAVQIQHGVTPEKAFTCQDKRLRIEPVPEEAWQPGGRKFRKTRCWIRVGSSSKNPIWAVIPFVMHRPIPSDAMIKWAYLIRRRIGTHFEWSLVLSLSREAGWAKLDTAKTGEVGIDVGWRMRPDGKMRVAYWLGNDGSSDELTLPAYWLTEMRKTEHIQSVRDENFNAARDAAVAAMRALGTTAVPEWAVIIATPAKGRAPKTWDEIANNISYWKSAARLAGFTLRWRDSALPAALALEQWRKRDKHLYEYEANLRDQLQGMRRDIYRKFAAQMRRKYHTAIIENLDLRDFHVLPHPEETPADKAVREHTRDACLSTLTGALRESMTEVVEVPAAHTTTIHACGSAEAWDRRELTHRCSRCDVVYDQDRNAALNLLRTRAAMC